MNCIYARPGYCAVRRNMNCHEDCSYYLEEEEEKEESCKEQSSKEKIVTSMEEAFNKFIEELQKKYIKDEEEFKELKKQIYPRN
jgi:hypothetical protein